MTFRAFIVEDNSTVRHNLIDTLEELADVVPAGTAETEHEAKRWLASQEWDLAIVDLFLRIGSGLNVVEACRGAQAAPEGGGAQQPFLARRALALQAARRRCGVRQVDRAGSAGGLLRAAPPRSEAGRCRSAGAGGLEGGGYSTRDGCSGSTGLSRLGASAPAESRMG
jgi:CheY-like chemotaxis protein